MLHTINKVLSFFNAPITITSAQPIQPSLKEKQAKWFAMFDDIELTEEDEMQVGKYIALMQSHLEQSKQHSEESLQNLQLSYLYTDMAEALLLKYQK